MTRPNILQQILACAQEHPDDVAVQSLVSDLTNARDSALAMQGLVLSASTLQGYERGTAGEDGYYLFGYPDGSFLNPLLKHSYNLHKVSVIAECLQLVLVRKYNHEFDE